MIIKHNMQPQLIHNTLKIDVFLIIDFASELLHETSLVEQPLIYIVI